ncbi:hypothetical protein KC19_1G124400 [Ceratodon purpureus]|uniref:Uncharacterized protein n=1 Tax=Ceratodon purpureus TaxID=3225 RepID=A0A8T0J711_CERPU|nr:hypothetical protein KC19_1G124400 [Ceratodon purpureus]
MSPAKQPNEVQPNVTCPIIEATTMDICLHCYLHQHSYTNEEENIQAIEFVEITKNLQPMFRDWTEEQQSGIDVKYLYRLPSPTRAFQNGAISKSAPTSLSRASPKRLPSHTSEILRRYRRSIKHRRQELANPRRVSTKVVGALHQLRREKDACIKVLIANAQTSLIANASTSLERGW